MVFKDLQRGYVFYTYNATDAQAYWDHLVGHETYPSVILQSSGHSMPINMHHPEDGEILDVLADVNRGTIIPASCYMGPNCHTTALCGTPRVYVCPTTELMRPTFILNDDGRLGVPLSKAATAAAWQMSFTLSPCIRSVGPPNYCELEYDVRWAQISFEIKADPLESVATLP